jgi:hypothetical protein
VALEGLLRHTDREHADHTLLQKALEDLNDIINFIEEGARWRQNQEKMAAIKVRTLPSYIWTTSTILLKVSFT